MNYLVDTNILLEILLNQAVQVRTDTSNDETGHKQEPLAPKANEKETKMRLSGVACVIVSLMLFLAGCGTPSQKGMFGTIEFYSGSDLSTSEVAVLNIRAPLRLIPQMDEPQNSPPDLFFFPVNHRIALKPGTYTRSFFFHMFVRTDIRSKGGNPGFPWSVIITPSSPVAFTLDAGRQYAVLYTLKSPSEKQSLGPDYRELTEIQKGEGKWPIQDKHFHRYLRELKRQQMKDTNQVTRIIRIFPQGRYVDNPPRYQRTPLAVEFKPLIVDITTDKELARLIQTSDDWLPRWYALDLIKDLGCIDLFTLSTSDPNPEVRKKATRLAESLSTGRPRTHQFDTFLEKKGFMAAKEDYWTDY